jgi:uncharacterized damage-inducible protein DinB
MTVAEVLLEDFDSEMAGTRKTLERVPEDTGEFKPHEKSMVMGKLAMHIAAMPVFATYIIEDPGMDMAKPTRERVDLTFRTREIMLDTFDSLAAAARAALAGASDEALAAKWPFRFGDHMIMDESRAKTYRVMFFNHMIHHRAQLGVYLRMNDVPVPGLYGPSADEPFKP